MRLIDADALIEKVRKWYWDKGKQDTDPMFADLWVNLFITTIKESQTVFNLENVIQQIDLKSFDYYTKSGSVIDTDDACEIIKKGGIPNDV